ncbi:MAG: restriction endonuclease subunit S, partial [Flavobacterium sp.]|nr:restriction endonuclease subunit S [Flavobacterium sp.]
MKYAKTKLIEIAEIIMGQSPESKFVSNEIIGLPLLNGPAEFTDKFPIPIQYTSESKRLSEKYDILFCVRGSTTGRMNIADQKYAIGRGLAAIRHRKGYKLNTYIKAQIEINLKKLLGGTLGSVFPNLTKENLYNLE